MRYAAIKYNDTSNDNGICVSLFLQGCPHHCSGCWNPETWDFNGGYEFTYKEISTILEKIGENGIKRNFCVLGGEPLCEENAFTTSMIIQEVRRAYPDIKIYIWSGYTIKELLQKNNSYIMTALNNANVLIDGRYIETQRDLSLPMRGSKNQNIIDLKKYLNDIPQE